MTIQLSLIENVDELPRRLEQVDLASLPADEALVGRNVHDKTTAEEIEALAQSINDKGQFVPILLAEIDGKLELRDGRKRIIAMRILGKDKIWAEIFENAAGIPPADWVLIANNFRSTNQVMQIDALLELAKKGTSMEELKKRSGLNKAEIERLLNIGNLEPELRKAVEDGRMTLNAAQAALKLRNPVLRQPLVDAAAQGKKITEPMVKAQRNLQTQAAVQAQPLPNIPAPTVPTGNYLILEADGVTLTPCMDMTLAAFQEVMKFHVGAKGYRLIQIL